MTDNEFSLIALTQIKGIGPVLAKNLISYCGGASNVFNASKKDLMKAPGIAEKNAAVIAKHTLDTERIQQRLDLQRKHGISYITYLDAEYPRRLLQIPNSPLILYYKGKIPEENQHWVSVVGTRIPSEYGKDKCTEIIQSLKQYDAVIVSGLAYGIDSIAHRTAVRNDMSTVGVLGHGLDYVYPESNTNLAMQMVESGALVSEYLVGSKVSRENFPARNRIIAALSDITIVVESAKKGGSMITAEFANAYSRDVFAFPGRVNDKKSKGCNHLIKSHKAHLLENVSDIEYICRWDTEKQAPRQLELFQSFSPKETMVVDVLKMDAGLVHIDALFHRVELDLSSLSSVLLELEFKGIVRSHPGKQYSLNT